MKVECSKCGRRYNHPDEVKWMAERIQKREHPLCPGWFCEGQMVIKKEQNDNRN